MTRGRGVRRLDKHPVSTFECDDKCVGPCCVELPEGGPLDSGGVLPRGLEFVEGDMPGPYDEQVGESDGVEEVDLLDEGPLLSEEVD